MSKGAYKSALYIGIIENHKRALCMKKVTYCFVSFCQKERERGRTIQKALGEMFYTPCTVGHRATSYTSNSWKCDVCREEFHYKRMCAFHRFITRNVAYAIELHHTHPPTKECVHFIIDKRMCAFHRFFTRNVAYATELHHTHPHTHTLSDFLSSPLSLPPLFSFSVALFLSLSVSLSHTHVKRTKKH